MCMKDVAALNLLFKMADPKVHYSQWKQIVI